jgi:hypothetical protein
MAKILLLDIETSPYTALVWGVRKQYLTSRNLLDTQKVLSWAAKWYGEDDTYFDSLGRNDEESMLLNMHDMISEADIVITYNGNSFDLPTLNRDWLKHGITPPAPYASLDLYRTVRSRFRFSSNKLDDVCQELGLGKKTEHRGLMLWYDCMLGKRDAWQEMETYNTNDVIMLEALYDRVKPWITNHPNLSVLSGDLCCPTCGSKKFQNRGERKLASGLFHRYQCSVKSCGKWFRSSVRVEAAPPRMIAER